jgi:hypothetical protein
MSPINESPAQNNSLLNSTIQIKQEQMLIHLISFQKRRGNNYPSQIILGQHYLDTKTVQGFNEKKLLINILDQHRCKNSQHNSSKPNSTLYLKDHLL